MTFLKNFCPWEQMLALSVEDVTATLERWCGRMQSFWEFKVYLSFLLLSIAAWFVVYDGMFSALVAIAATLQLCGNIMLALQVSGRKTVRGISMKGIELSAIALWLRLSCNLRYSAYLPVDYSGTWFYQLMEGLSFVVLVFLIAQSAGRYRGAADRSSSRFFLAILPLAGAAAFATHPDVHRRVLPNVCWMAAVYVEVASVVPQLRTYMTDFFPISGHWIFCTFASRLINLVFWNDASKYFNPESLEHDLSVYCLIASQCLHVCLLFLLFSIHLAHRVLDYKLPWHVLM